MSDELHTECQFCYGELTYYLCEFTGECDADGCLRECSCVN